MHSKELRIVMSGASGTGKTTVAKLLAEITGLPICPIGARSVAADMGFDSPYDVDRASLPIYKDALGNDPKFPEDYRRAASLAIQYCNKEDTKLRGFFQDILLKRKMEWELANKSFISDRSVIDNLAYSSIESISSVADEYLHATMEYFPNSFTYLFFFPILTNFVDNRDPIRKSDRNYHIIYEALLSALIDKSVERNGSFWAVLISPSVIMCGLAPHYANAPSNGAFFSRLSSALAHIPSKVEGRPSAIGITKSIFSALS